MKKIIPIFSAMLIFINILLQPITASAAAFSFSYDNYYNAEGRDVREMSAYDAFYAATFYDGNVVKPNFGETVSDGDFGCIILYDSNRIYKFYVPYSNIGIKFSFNSNNVFSYSNVTTGLAWHALSLSDYLVKHDPFVQHGITYSDNSISLINSSYTILYSDFDIYNSSGDVIYDHDLGYYDYKHYYAQDLNVSYYPDLSLNMDFSSVLVGGARDEYGRPVDTVTHDYSATGTLSYSGQWTYQYCVFVSTSPPEVLYNEGINPTQSYYYVDFDGYLNSVVYVAGHDTTYWCASGNPNYPDLTDFIQAKGYLAWYVVTPSADSHFTLDLSKIPDFSVDTTYYATVWGFYRPQGLSASFTTFPYAVSFDQVRTEGYDIELVHCQPFSVNDLTDYVPSSNRERLDDGTLVDITRPNDNLFNGGVPPRSSVKFNPSDGTYESFTPSTDFGTSSGGIGSFGDLVSSSKSVIPFLKNIINCFPSDVADTFWVCLQIILAFIVVGVILYGIHFILSLFV